MTNLRPVADTREAAFERFFRVHHAAIFAFACRRADPATAHEVTADTFAIAWRKWEELPHERPLPWLYGVARRVLANARRTERRQQALIELLASRSQAAPQQHGFVLAALGRLSDSDRDALLLVAWEGLSAEEAAAALGVSYASFRVRAHRARRRLAKLLSEQALAEEPAAPPEEPAAPQFSDQSVQSKERRYG